jgi:hypothetical protein
MNALPEALRPWREWLNWFEPELAEQLGVLMQRLHPMLGPFRGSSQGGEPEMEGLDDLRARGSYEHLLSTEWLLAEEMPDEFLRRAASGEHIFLAPRPRARRADRSIVALFDAGPMQFGAPRLAHLAIWILLARRARQAQGEFRWGSVQAPGELFESSTADHLRALLNHRTFEMPDDGHFARWHAAMEPAHAGGERWLIASSHDAAEWQTPSAFTHCLRLQKNLPGDMLDVSLRERGTDRSLRLPLPEAGVVAPLLRGTFMRESRPEHHGSDPRAIALKLPPVISFDGTRIAVSLRDQPGALVYVVPRSVQDQPATARYQQWSRGYSALGMSFIGKQIGVLLADEQELRFWGSALASLPRPTQEQFLAPGSTATWLPLAWLRRAKAQRVCIIDQCGRLLNWDTGDIGLRLVTPGALGMVQINKDLVVCAYHQNGAVKTARISASGDPIKGRHLCNAPANAPALFGRGRVCAVRLEAEPAEVWHVGTWSNLGFAMQARLPTGSRVVGVMRDNDRRTSLITLDGSLLRLHFTEGSNELLYAAPHRVVSCTVCPNTSLVAMLTERRQFIVVSAATRTLLLTVQTASHSDASA